MKIIPQYNRDLLYRYDRTMPRYTSYPTALQFQPDFSIERWREALDNSPNRDKPLSLYFHIPFCRSPCFYCACSRIITRDHSRSLPYLDAVIAEMALVAQQLPKSRRKVQQIHLGGGTPTFLSLSQLRHLWESIQTHFDILDDGEYSIEVDPRAADVEMIEELAKLGFNRMSFGVQDLDPTVQKAVNRIQSPEETFAQMNAARAAGVESVNVDLIYGLPMQTQQTFADTIDRVLEHRPERAAIYAYAHMPEMIKAQRQIDKYSLPDVSEKLSLLELAIDRFQAAGYDYIGLDHFALPDDTLAKARSDNSLQRNFQGYATQSDADMLGFGVTSIGKVGDTFYQNLKTEAEYLQAVQAGQLPISKGYSSSADDRLRGQVIMDLMCQGQVNFDRFYQLYDVSFRDYFADTDAELAAMAADGLLTMDEHNLQITPAGQLLLRHVANVFDAYRTPAQRGSGAWQYR
ncbi:oxygen-independent coproporphyrinogen III oxidase [Reinekea sp. G2M2-21]|uniref:oxygen-independent coproporphyrinogen III oxidase n=1 Tax=Reinekea sp. G2M2-21 TaxID=2788942 RepID=UPI0018AB21D1|nr:oxygen-independent coproporphyrinogen III oxidase [Reinekea sp. G2M2-21]